MKTQILKSCIKKHTLVLICCTAISILSSCEKEKKDPKIETTSISGIAASEYYVTAKIVEKGDYKISDHGFVFYVGSESMGAYYSDRKVSLGSIIENDTFSTVLNIGSISYYSTGYRCYARSYITNEKGTLYGNIISAELLRLQLNSVEPNKGKAGDTVSLNGSNFSKDVQANRVYFGNNYAQVISGTSKMLKVIVPFGLSSYYGNIFTVNVQCNSEAVSLQDAFRLLASPTGFSPTYGSWNTSITISGSGMYDASVYFDDVYVARNTSSSDYFTVYVPHNFLKKKFKLFLSSEGVKTEIPGGYFTLDDLVVYPPSSYKFSRGTSAYFSGSGFNHEQMYTKLLLGATVINASNCYDSYAYFNIPNYMELGTYVGKLTNSIDTVTLNNPITIIAK